MGQRSYSLLLCTGRNGNKIVFSKGNRSHQAFKWKKYIITSITVKYFDERVGGGTMKAAFQRLKVRLS